MTGLRAQQKEQRINAILDAAADAFDEHPLHEVTTEAIAERAGVSPATVYNLVGTRNDLIEALIIRVVDDMTRRVGELFAEHPDDPIAISRAISELAVDGFTTRSDAFRRIMSVVRPTNRPVFADPSLPHARALARAREIGILRPDVDPDALARQVFMSWLGAMWAWAYIGLDDDGFRVAVRHGHLTVLISAVQGEHLDQLRSERAAITPLLEAAWQRR